MFVIIGQGAAGTTAANTLRSLDGKVPVTMVSNELDYFYSRIDLPDILAGKYSPQDSARQTPEEFAAKSITCRMGETVKEILPAEKAIVLASGEKIPYGKLLLATGSSPVIPPFKGTEAAGVHVLWTMAQVRALQAAVAGAKSAVVAGAGLIGLKAALALRKLGLKVTVVEKLSYFMPRQLDETAARMLEEAIRAQGIDIRTGTGIEEIEVLDGKAAGARLPGETLPCDLVLLAVGVQPNAALAASAGIKVGRGIIVDECLRTSLPDIYAAGDAAEVYDPSRGSSAVPAIWPAAVEQGRLAAWNMQGLEKPYVYSGTMNSVEIAGVPLISVGDIDGEGQDQILVSRRGGSYKKVVLRGQAVRGVLFLGDIRQAGVLANLVIRRTETGIERPLSPAFSFTDLMAI